MLSSVGYIAVEPLAFDLGEFNQTRSKRPTLYGGLSFGADILWG